MIAENWLARAIAAVDVHRWRLARSMRSPPRMLRFAPTRLWLTCHERALSGQKRAADRAADAADPGIHAIRGRERRAAVRVATFALVWANSPARHLYEAVWHTPIGVRLAGWSFERDLALLDQRRPDGRVLLPGGAGDQARGLAGELATPRRAALPDRRRARRDGRAGADLRRAQRGRPRRATGGASPWRPTSRSRWACSRCSATACPTALKVFLAALAIVDDIGAVLVIAVFYTAHISWTSLAFAGAFFVALIAMNRIGARHPLIYAL